MRYRVKKDFVLNGTLLAWGDSLYLRQAQEKEKWEVYSLFTRQLVGTINSEEVKTYLNEDENPPKERFKRSSGGKSIRDISLSLALFILPLWGRSQQVITIGSSISTAREPVQWTTKMVQTADDMFELHLSAKIDSSWFLYPLNERKKCELCPVLKLEPNNLWEAIEGPDLYYYGNKIPFERCGSLPSPYCPATRYLDSVVYIQSIKCRAGRNCSIKGRIEYYPTSRDSVGPHKILMFARSLYSTSEQPVTKIITQ